MKMKEVKQDLIDQLRSNGIYGNHYDDMVDKYMEFWKTHKELSKEIKKDNYLLPSSHGMKLNPAVEARNKNNTQMLKILSTLGIKAPASSNYGDDDDDL